MDLLEELDRFERMKLGLLVNHCIPIFDNILKNEYCDGCFYGMENQLAHTCMTSYTVYEDEDNIEWEWTDSYERQFKEKIYNIVHEIDKRLFLDGLTKMVQHSFEDPSIYINKLSDPCWRDSFFISILPGGILYGDVKCAFLKKYDDEIQRREYEYFKSSDYEDYEPSPTPSPPRKKRKLRCLLTNMVKSFYNNTVFA